jgi:hypothetical protein
METKPHLSDREVHLIRRALGPVLKSKVAYRNQRAGDLALEIAKVYDDQ